jgi:hypothetical protein
VVEHWRYVVEHWRYVVEHWRYVVGAPGGTQVVVLRSIMSARRDRI